MLNNISFQLKWVFFAVIKYQTAVGCKTKIGLNTNKFTLSHNYVVSLQYNAQMQIFWKFHHI